MISLAWLIPVFPLLGFLIISLGKNYFSKQIAGILASSVVFISFILSLGVFFDINASVEKVHTLTLFDWVSTLDFSISIAFLIDPLTCIMLLIITGIGFLIHLYSMGYMHDDERYSTFFSYLNLFVFFMLLLVMGDNYFLLFAGWEGVGLASYLLIGFWFKNHENNDAAKKAFIMNRIGDLGFVLGIILIFSTFGSIQFAAVSEAASRFSANETTLVAITLLLFIGAMGKSAQIPLYTWLPDAMAGPTPVSALIHAATMVTAGIYMIARSNVLYSLAPFTLGVIAVIGIVTALFAATIGIFQNDIKKVLAYSTVSQLGYMFLGLGVGAYTGAVFHLMTHAFFKALLFLGAGSVIHAMGGEQDIRKMGGLKKYVPVTYMTFLIATLAISGIFPFSGFFSKDEILAHAFAQHPLLWVAGVLGSLMTAFYMFRLFYMTFYGAFRGTHEQEHHLHESPKTMTIPLIILAVLSFAGGFLNIPKILFGNTSLEHFLEPVFEKSNNILFLDELSHSTEYLLMGVTLSLLILMILWTRKKYIHAVIDPKKEPKSMLAKMIYNKYYVDEIYNAVFVVPTEKISSVFYQFLELKGIDRCVNFAGSAAKSAGNQVRKLQTGHIGFYIFMMVLGIAAILYFNFN